MPNYYEMLHIEPGASPDEVENAYETQYNQWRRLVTHHDQQVVNQANQTLQALETIRTTLMDASKRASYDAGIGLGGAVGGLADPAALLKSLGAPSPHPLMAPPPPAPAAVAQPMASAPAGLWHCAKCGTDNPAQTKFCFQCGNQLVRQCPDCGRETSLVATGMCGECGFGYEVATHRAELRGQIGVVHQQIQATRTTRETLVSNANQNNAPTVIGVGLTLVGLISLTNSFGLGVLLLMIAAAVIYYVRTTRQQQQRKADMLAQSITDLEGKQRALQAEIATTKLANRM